MGFWRKKLKAATFLGRLRRDARGNTLAIMAIALIPMSAMAGSAIDVARMYVVKVRLQQACDAGVLAGRKFMTDSDSTELDDTAKARAKTFFDNNFREGWMKTSSPAFTARKTADKQVAATASAVVPMSIMKMFNMADAKIEVACEARYDIADTDVMFVLDTTGSMACKPDGADSCGSSYTYTRPASTDAVPGYADTTGYAVTEETSNGKNVSRIQALRAAVPDFYTTMTANSDATTHIRYGFVTYSSMVNAGKAIMDISPSYIIGGSGSAETQWTYQSRMVTGDYNISNGNWGDNSSYTKANCPTASARTPAATQANAYTYDPSTGRATVVDYQTTSTKCQSRTRTVGPVWTYKPVTYDVRNYLLAAGTQNPAMVTTSISKWWGCIEERDTTAGQTTFYSNSLPPDLDPDLVPSAKSSQWRPYWPDVEFIRGAPNVYPTSNGDSDNYQSYTDPDRMKLGKNGCAKPVQRLKTMTADDISKFVNAADFKPVGGTYHDVGMIWGVRLLSPKGLFKADTSAWPGRPAPKRVIVFFTDGAMAPSEDAYSLYGVEKLDRRVTGGDTDDRVMYHNKRFLAACQKAKDMGIDVWTVAIAKDPDTNLQACASSNAQALNTTTGSGLSDAFKKIAQQVAMLRMSK